MNQFTQALDEAIELANNYSESDEQELLEHIFDTSPYQDESDFALANTSYYDALELAQSNDQFIIDAKEYLIDNSPEPILTADPVKLAYHLAYTDSEYGTKLLAELEYYRSQGRL